MLRALLRFLGFIFSWATLGAIMGAGGLVALFWAFGKGLPNHEQLAQYAPPTLSRIYSGEGRVMDEFARERRLFTPIDEIPDIVKHAFVSAEDKNFYVHAGYDPLGIVKAIVDAARGGRLRGASTITQQVMKNFLLSGDRSGERKIKEIILATRLEETLSKDEILELYLNEIFLGQNSFGVTAAALTYFGKTLEELSPAEVAYLAAIPKGPSQYHPVRQKDRAIARRNYVLNEMVDNGYLDAQIAEAAKAADLLTVQSGHYESSRADLPARDYFTDEIRRQLSAELGEEELFTGGLAIRATMDPELQHYAAEALREQLEGYDRALEVYWGPQAHVEAELLGSEPEWRQALAELRVPRDIAGWHPAVILRIGDSSARIGIEDIPENEDGHYIFTRDEQWARPVDEEGEVGSRPSKPADLWEIGDVIYVSAQTDSNGNFERWALRQIPAIQGAFMVMDALNGRVLAMQGGFSYQTSAFNRATQARRQPGSAFKPFVYAAALDNGYTPASIVVDAPVEVDTGDGVWRPQNASRKFYGPAPLRTGIEYSRNLMTVRIAQHIGMDVVAEYAERFGVYDNMPGHLAYSLGSGETTLFRIVAAYAMFANGGLQVEPTLVDRVQDRNGNTVYRHDQRLCDGCNNFNVPADREPWVRSTAQRIMDPVTAYQLTSMMRGVVARGTASATVGKLGVPIAGKTGTTNEAKDAWFVGFTPRVAAGCYMGYDTPQPLGRGASGGKLCGPVFASFMEKFLENREIGELVQPPGTVFVKIDRYSGVRLPDDEEGEWVVSELFRAGEEPQFGAYGEYIDGGFTMGRDLLLFTRGESASVVDEALGIDGIALPPKPTFGNLSSGGLY